MKFSIIIPVYNEEKTLIELVNKVKSVNIGNIKKEKYLWMTVLLIVQERSWGK